MRKLISIGCYLAVGSVLLSGCSEGGDSWEEGSEASSETVLELEAGRQLALGAEGPVVQAVNQHFLEHGYYENPALAESHPDWMPVVGEPPAQMDVFDEQLESALITFQSRAGLDVTGAIDQATLNEMDSHNCDWPESYEDESEDASEQKWHLNSARFVTGTSVTYRVANYPCEFLNQGVIEVILGCEMPSRSEIDTVLARAFTSWSNSTKLSFSKTTSTSATITFKWAALSGTTLASTTGSGAREITFSSSRSWSTGTSAVSGKYSLEAVGLHEIGHALGFKHTTVKIGSTNPVMWPSISTGAHIVTFGPDDYQGIMASPYTQWAQAPGKAIHIASNMGVTWAISTTDASAGGKTILYWNGSAWETVSGGAVKVAIGTDRVPWLINSSNKIYYRSGVASSNGYKGTDWTLVSGTATDIAVGGTTVYIAGTVSGGSQGKQIFRRESSGSWTQLAGAAVHIAADTNGTLWSVGTNNAIGRMLPGATVWTTMPGQARDIAASGGAAWIIGVGAVGSNYEIFVWNEQAAGTSGSPVPEAKYDWVKTDGSAVTIAVDNGPSPWVTNSNNDIFHRIQ